MKHDFFQILGQVRRPWVDLEPLKEAFHRRAADAHPDTAGNQGGFAELNEAYRVLKDPGLRLRHFLELEQGTTVPGPVPSALSDLYMAMAGLGRRHQRFLAERDACSGALAKALLAPEDQSLREQWQRIFDGLERANVEAEQRLRLLDQQWPDRAALPGLAQVQQEFAYLGKWTHQVAEALLALDL